MAALRAEGLISGTQPFVHEVPHSHRSGQRIEPLISLQWFCDMTRLAEPAIAAAKDGYSPVEEVSAETLGGDSEIVLTDVDRVLDGTWFADYLATWKTTFGE